MVHSSFGRTAEKRTSGGNPVSVLGTIEELEERVLRVITLEGKITIHNAFPDRGFKP